MQLNFIPLRASVNSKVARLVHDLRMNENESHQPQLHFVFTANEQMLECRHTKLW